MRGLAYAFRFHRGALEFDWRRFVGAAFSDVLRGRMSVGEASRIFMQLIQEPESALARAINGGVRPWQQLEHLVTDLYDVWADKPHPRPQTPEQKKNDVQRARALQRARNRARERALAIERGEIT